jgi:FkbM family methyltransferase
MMASIRNRIGQIARLPARMWHHGRLWSSRRTDIANWRELWSLSNPVWLVVGKRISSNGSPSDVVVRFRNGLSLAVDSSMRGDLAALVDTYPGYMRNLGVSLSPGDVVIDVGAHIGSFSLRALFDNPGLKVLAFEPDPQNFGRLKANARRNGLEGKGFNAYNLAVSSAEGHLMFARGRTSTTGSIARTGFFKAPADAETVVVSATTIESIFRQHSIDRCRLLKVDCEGSEYDILDQLPDGILSRIDSLIVEVHPARAGNPEQLKRALQTKGFEVIEHSHGNGCSDLYCRRRPR